MTSSRPVLSEATPADVLAVARNLPKDEINQIEVLSGKVFDPQYVAEYVFRDANVLWCYKADEPLVIAGFIQLTPVVWRTVFLATKRAWAEHGRAVTMATVEALQNVIGQKEHIRVEVVCLKKRKLAQRWYNTIGLEYESTLKAYGTGGESAVMYVKTK